MNQGTKIAIGLLLLAALVTFLIFRKDNRESRTPHSSSVSQQFQGKEIKYSRHARCRMNCRKIDEQEVQEIIAYGNINHSKSRKDHRGQSYALEGRTHDHQNVRIIVAPDDNELTIVTVIDLDTDWKCECD